MDTITVTADYRVDAGQLLEFKYTEAFFIDGRNGTDPSLTIAGSVYSYLDAGSPIYGGPLYGIIFAYDAVYPTDLVKIEATGVLKVSHTAGRYGGAYGFYTQNHSADFSNAGLVDISSNSGAFGVVTYESNHKFDLTNTGVIKVHGPDDARGVDLFNGGVIVNSGRIEVDGGSTTFCDGVRVLGFGSTLLNSGTISAVASGATVPSIAVDWQSSGGITGEDKFVNSGTLKGDYALLARPYLMSDPDPKAYEFTNTGSMIGKVSFQYPLVRFINSGLITGVIDLGFGDDTLDGHAGIQQGMVEGGGGQDSIAGGSGSETIVGGDGDDTISGGGGSDVLVGEAGQDLLSGGGGGDTFVIEKLHSSVQATEIDRISEWSADDRLKFGDLTGYSDGGLLAKLSAGDLTSATFQAAKLIADGSASYVAVQVGSDVAVFNAGEAVLLLGRTLSDFTDSQIVRNAAPPPVTHGGDGSDSPTLTNGADTFDGAGGDDFLFGVFGNDSLEGGPGNDVVSGGQDNDTVDGGAGNDDVSGDDGNDLVTDPSGTNTLRGGAGDDSIVGGTGFDDINGNQGNDTCVSGGGDDWVVGGKDNDSLVGSDGQNLVYGNLGNDTCDGGAGNDIVRGGQDNDSLMGGAGDDFVSGDKGDDTMVGGTGADIFHTFGDAGIDRVLDFHVAEGDRVQLDPGTQYTVAQVGADTVISMTGGGQMILVGVQMSTLPSGWIFGA